ncbi:MAG: acyl-CoA thioesterase [Gammaproteobacteria bacterium]|nr:acyl-CoA thioesterase [Gammaproteobacteria bacterium]
MSKALEDFIAQYPLTLNDDVRWGDMDAFGHVNNTVYYRYFESARVLMDERISFHDAENNIGAILAEQSCRYRIPVIYPDTLTIGLRNIEIREFDVIQEYALFSHTHQAIAATGTGRLVRFDYRNNSKVMIDDNLRRRLQTIEWAGA